MKLNKIMKNDFILLFVVFILISVTIYIKGRNIVGPVVFADEMIYMEMARRIFFKHSLHGFYLYNPLYPLFISIVFFSSEFFKQYLFIKIINAVLFSSMTFPLFFLLRKMFSRKQAYLLLLLFLLLPWSNLSIIVWAEPLYYSLFAWSLFFLYSFLEETTIKNAFISTFFMGLMFLTKQGGAIVFIIASIITIGIDYAIFSNKKRKEYSLFLIFLILFMSPWIIRNLINTDPQSSILGYSNEFTIVKENFLYFESLFTNLLNQLSALIVSVFLFPFVFFVRNYFDLRNRTPTMRKFYIFSLFLIFGIIGITALHRLTNPLMPMTRYSCICIIPILIGFVDQINKLVFNKKNVALLGLISILALGNVYFFSPIKASVAYSTFTNTEIIYLLTLFSLPYEYTPIRIYDPNLDIMLVAFLVLLLIIVIAKNKKHVLIYLILFSCFLFSSYSSLSFIQRTMKVGYIRNELICDFDNTYSGSLFLDENYYDELKFYMGFWYGEENYQSVPLTRIIEQNGTYNGELLSNDRMNDGRIYFLTKDDLDFIEVIGNGDYKIYQIPIINTDYQ